MTHSEEIIKSTWTRYSHLFDASKTKQLKIPVIGPVQVDWSLQKIMPTEPVDSEILIYQYTEENFYNCVVGMVVCEGVYVWRGVVAQWT